MKYFPLNVPLFLYGEEIFISFLLRSVSTPAVILNKFPVFHLNRGPAQATPSFVLALRYFCQYTILRYILHRR